MSDLGQRDPQAAAAAPRAFASRNTAQNAADKGPGWLRWSRSGENGLVVGVLVALVSVPLAEMVLRKATNFGIVGSTSFVQHFTLLVGVLGGAIAARDNRLLSLSTLPDRLKGKWQWGTRVFSATIGAAVSGVLCLAAWRFIHSEPAGKILAYGVPIRFFQYFLPIGFGAVSLRICWHAAGGWTGRLVTLLLATGVVCGAAYSPVDPATLVWPAIIGLAVATILGAPLFIALAGVAMVLFWGAELPVSLIPLEHYYLVTDPILPSIPLFTLAGYFLAEGGASRRLVRVFRSLLGAFRGGPGIVTALVCAFFTSFTGASGVTILALGGLLMPALVQARYSEKTAVGLVTGAGSLGLLFPPCLPLILYAVIAQRTIQYMEFDEGTVIPEVTINKLFLAGIGPGILLLALTAWWAIKAGPKIVPGRERFNGREAWASLWAAKWELLLPVIVLVVMFGGFGTPVEAAAVAAFYALVTQVVIHRDLHLFRDIPRVMAECGLLIGGVLLILGVAMGLTKYLIIADVPTIAVEWMQTTVRSPWMFLLMLNLALIVVGCLMDIYSAVVVIVPLIVPMGLAFGIDPVHLGIVFLANLQLGFLTPPVGMNLFLSSYRFNKPLSYVTRATFPMLLVLAVGVLLITYLPLVYALVMNWVPSVYG